MIKARDNPNSFKSKDQVIFEYVLLALCLCIIALRTTFTENPNPQSANQPTELSDIVYSLSISAVLIFSFLSWCLWSFLRKRFSYRFTAIEIGLCLFTIAALVAGLAASDKRAAITDFVTMLAPILMAVLLVQILDSKPKIKLLLAVIAALGVISAYQCSSQLLAGNRQLVEFYEQNPDEVLAQQNIDTNTLKHWQFEHRLYSKDISGFFTTSNSAGSFALLASFAGIALFIDHFRNRKSSSSTRQLILCGLGVVIIIFGLVITQSKGALAASLVAAAMFAFYLLSPKWLKTHKTMVLLVCLLLALVAGCAVVQYGITHGWLPGGNSMLVRWQYWHASAQMYADHPRTGVGPGNFAHIYFHYKPPSAMEEVADPHNFLLSILTQYGLIGLVAFLAMIFLPLRKVIFTKPSLSSTKAQQPEPNLRKFALPVAIAISVSLLLIRPILIPIKTGGYIDVTMGPTIYLIVMIYVIFVLYIAPVVAFAVGLWLLTANHNKTEHTDLGYTRAALFCAICAFLIHNLIDFAVFEPGASTAFWAVLACLIAANYHQKPGHQLLLKPTLPVRMLITAVGLVLAWAYLDYALIPPAKSAANIHRATHATSLGRYHQAHNFLARAAEDDPLSPTPSALNAELYLHHFKVTASKDRNLLDAAKDSLLEAINRHNAYFKNFERLADGYILLAEISRGQEKTDSLNKAFLSAYQAIKRYPASGRLHIERAGIAEMLGKTDMAIEHYKQAINIEDKYREQFRQMYPEKEIFSRLGEEEYQFAKHRIEQLSK
jgi:O-antigen ligase